MKRAWSRRALLYALVTGAWIMAFDLAADLLDSWHRLFGELHVLLAACTVLFLYALLGWELRRREQAEHGLQRARDELEVRVEERTAKLRQANEALQVEIAERIQTLELSRQRQAEVTALLEGARAVLAFRGFEDAARSILDACKNLLEVSAGCVVLPNGDGIQNEVWRPAVALGWSPCTVDSALPRPVRDLREEAYRSGRTVYRNDLPGSDEATPIHLPASQELRLDIENALFAPLQIRGITVGLMGLVNKQGGFTENDARMASAFSELVAIALFNGRTIESLENSEQRFRSVAQTANEAIVTVDSRASVVFWNHAAETMFGYSGEEIIGQPFTLIMPRRLRAACENGIRRALSTGQSELIGKVIEAVGLGKDGNEFPIEHSFAAWKTREGAFFTGVIHNITDRKQADLALRQAHEELEVRVQVRTAQLAQINEVLQEEIAERTQTEKELRASEERFRQLAENLREIFWITDAQTGQMLYVSPVYEEIWRRSCQSLYEQPTSFLDAIHPEDRERISASLESQAHGGYDEQYRIVRPDSSTRWIRARTFPIEDEKGEVYRIAGIAEDITERALAFHLMEQRVEERTHELSTLLEASRSMASTLNMDELLGLILDQLGAVVEYGSASMYTLEGQELWAVAYRGPLAQERTVGLRTPLGSLAAHEKTVSQRAPLVISDLQGDSTLAGDFRASAGKRMKTQFAHIRSWMGVPLMIQERVIGLLGLHHEQADYYTSRHAELAMAFASQAAMALDNARLYQQAQELAAMQERQRLARDLHDSVSQTLFSASLSAGVLPRLWERDPAAGRFCLEELRQLTRGALAEMRTLLLELRPTALVETKLDELLRQLADAFSSRTRVPVTLNVEGQGLLPPTVQVTMYRIAQEALNNAAKHSGAGQVSVGLRYLEQWGNPGELGGTRGMGVELCISDDGQGFDLEDVSAEHLGLSIMRERAEAVSASLEIESHAGQGTLIRVAWREMTAARDEGQIANDK